MSQSDRAHLPCVVGFAAIVVMFVAILGEPGAADSNYPRDSKGERPIVALWTESGTVDAGKRLILAIWENGDVLWTNEMRMTIAPLVPLGIPATSARSVARRVSAEMRSYDDWDGQPGFLHEPTMVLGFVDVGGQCRVSTSHTMAPDLPTILKLRFNRIVVEDDAMRERFKARFTPHELAFIPHWNAAMSALTETMRDATAVSSTPRSVR